MRIQDPENKIPEDEPVFLLRGKDPLAPELLLNWATRLRLAGGDPTMARMVEDHAQSMLVWQAGLREVKLKDMVVLDETIEELYDQIEVSEHTKEQIKLSMVRLPDLPRVEPALIPKGVRAGIKE